MKKNNNNAKDLIKTFADKLIIRAYDNHWEELEIADLVLLISQELKLNSNSVLKFLNRIENASSITLNHLSENGYTFTSFELINFFELRASDVRHFITLITDSLEYKLISLSDGENINLLYSASKKLFMENEDYKRYAAALCEYCDSKSNYGKLLKIFTENMPLHGTAYFIRDIMKSSVFKDLKGSMDEFYAEINAEIAEMLKKLINDNFEFEGSDEDSNGNLKDFVVDEDDENENEDDEMTDGSNMFGNSHQDDKV